jgi:glucose-1-phosphate cytidylyltransferase
LKVVILAGGFGTRLSEYTENYPKPMVQIGKIPILCHIIKIYEKYGYKDFIIATGYKSNIINEFFLKHSKIIEKEKNYLNLEFKYKKDKIKINSRVSLVFTGLNTMTGGRLKKLLKYISTEDFMLTYGDGISNVNIINLVKFHKQHKKLATLTAVRPPVRFGELTIKNSTVTKFEEKPKLKEGWINGGFFVFNKKIIDFISGNQIMLEREPLEKLSRIKQLKAFKHTDFWQCMDTKRDKDLLEKIYKQNKKSF